MKISILGLGYVGAVSLACLARDGHEVCGVDIDQTKLDLIRSGRSPIIEAGIQDLMQSVVASGNVAVTDDVGHAIHNSDLSFVCVGTPSLPNGDQDLTAIRRLCEQIGESLAARRAGHVVVIRSTVQPGTVQNIVRPILEESSSKKEGVDFHLCFQPEFLREGSSIKDYDNPPFTIVGADSDISVETMKSLFDHLPCKFFATSIPNAEMVKYACNSFHALKVTFANEIARIAQALDVDGRAVMDLVCQDTSLNISSAYLRPGFAFGGSCLPKDLKALTYMAKSRDVNVPTLSSLLASNRVHIDHAVDFVLQSGHRDVGMIGLSFKSGTDDLRESPLVTLAERFIGKGLNLKIYDPEVNVARLVGANRRYIEESIPHIASVMADSCDDVIAHGKVLVVGLSDSAVAQAVSRSSYNDQQILDLVGSIDPLRVNGTVRGVCW